MSMMDHWLPVVGHEDDYEVCWTGEIRSHRRQGSSGGILKPFTNRWGYLQVGVRKNGEARTRSVHVIVATAFLGPRPEGLEIRHLDGDPTNNQVANLVYGTKSENAQDRIKHGRGAGVNITHCPQGHPYDDENTGRSPEGKRWCRTCKREKIRARRARMRAATG